MGSDKAYFHLDDCMNKQNYGYWGAESPRELYQRPPHSTKLTLWYVASPSGPYFFKEELDTVTVM